MNVSSVLYLTNHKVRFNPHSDYPGTPPFGLTGEAVFKVISTRLLSIHNITEPD